ncbi:flagellar basal body rod protein FlgB [Natranaerobius trueperi]|uniref:Flagellar basal body rod protein FlgB n=1 Tax=Natranaerobius trueperi TaxID=759412 RepID=A0A226BZJ6_9FIRM|nr:flagellar basal body rod protein FlgB [Natranaerobius trueperi]OWZ84222.1 flagellar basal body rod protein FlgB [Natranaerobius trueperi]
MFGDTPINLLGNSLNTTTKRHEVISNNIANVNTPGYKKQSVEFESILQDKINFDSQIRGKTTSDKHLPIGSPNNATDVEPKVITENTTSMRNDENNVDIDTEMARLSKNTIKHQTLTRQLSGELNKLRTAIQGGN